MQIIISVMLIIGIFPIINILCRAYNISDISSIMIFLSYGVQSVLDIIVTFLTVSFIRVKHRNKIHWTINILVGAIFGLISSILIREVSLIFWIISSMILAIVMKKVFSVDIEKISNTYLFLIVCFIYILVTFIGWQSEIETLRWFNIILFVIFSVMFAIVKNRSRLDSLISRRSKNLDSVPTNIYKYNRKLTIILCIIPIPFIAFSKKLGDALYNIFVSILRAIFNFGIYLSSLFKKDSVPIEDSSPEDTEVTRYIENSDSILGDIAMIFCIGLAIFLIYYYHEDILAKIREIIEEIKSIFKKSVSETVIDTLEVQSEEGYTDYITATPNIKYSKKIFKADYKSFLKMDNSIESYKFGYSILVYGLNILGYNIQNSDNVTEISNKTLDFLNSNELSKIYLSVRYNDSVPNQNDRTILNDVLKQVYKKI